MNQPVENDAERPIRETERRVANLTESLAKVGWSDALAEKLRAEEVQLCRLRKERAAVARRTERPEVPDTTAIKSYLEHLFGVLDADPARGRELLSRFVAPIVMTPESDGCARRYRATRAFNLAFLLSAVPSGSGKSGCAGAIGGLEHVFLQDFSLEVEA